jgi:hypothetical protein
MKKIRQLIHLLKEVCMEIYTKYQTNVNKHRMKI